MKNKKALYYRQHEKGKTLNHLKITWTRKKPKSFEDEPEHKQESTPNSLKSNLHKQSKEFKLESN